MIFLLFILNFAIKCQKFYERFPIEITKQYRILFKEVYKMEWKKIKTPKTKSKPYKCKLGLNMTLKRISAQTVKEKTMHYKALTQGQ